MGSSLQGLEVPRDPKEPGRLYSGPCSVTALLVREMKLWAVPPSMVLAMIGLVRKTPPARLGWEHEHPGTTSWAFQKPRRAGACPRLQKRSPGILVTSLALKKGCHQEGQGTTGHWPCPYSQALGPLGEIRLGSVTDASGEVSGL